MDGRNGETSVMPSDIWHVYLAECSDGTLYCGITRDLARRMAQHNGFVPGGARYTRGRRPVRLAASLACAGKSEALRLEWAVKRRPRAQKAAWLAHEGARAC